MKKKILGITLLLVMVLSLSSCSLSGILGIFIEPLTPAVELTDKALEADKIIDFANGADPDVLFESDGWSNGDVFNVVWKKNNVIYENGLLRLGITKEKATAWLGDAEVEFDYTAGEARTQNYYHYGDYEVSMKPSANPGTASTFFVCTGPYDTKFVLDENGDYVLDENGERVSVENPHDEIDIEFLGNDTTRVQFNFFVNGVGGNEYMYDLGFDASKEFHRYGFRWAEDSITWFVDGKPVYKVTTDKSVESASNFRVVEKLPSTAGRILTNYWCGTERAWGWMGVYAGETKDNGTQYQWISTSAEGAPLNPPEKPNEDITGIDWDAIDAIAPTFASTESYTVTNNDTQSNVTYTAVGGNSYVNVEMDITEASADKNYLHLTVTNNAETACRFRVNVVDMELVNAGAQNMSTNVSATMNGEAAFTDLSWGGSFFDLAAGQTAEIVIEFTGSVEKLQLMPDSSKNDSSVNAGDITVEDIKFAKVGDIDTPTPDPDPNPTPTPENPTSGDLTTTINGTEVTFGGNVTDGYGVNANDENCTLNVTYTNVLGNSYKNFWANVSSIAGTKNIFTMKVTNNGTASVKVRIDIESQSQVTANTTACNLSATQDGEGVYTDLEWGGSVFEIAAGATATLEVVYDASKLPTNLKIMVDSCQWDDSTSHAGDITISDMEFKGEYTPTDPDPNPNPNPNPDPQPSGESVTFTSEAGTGYTVDGTQVVNITYNGLGNTWKPVTANVAELAAGKNTFTVTIKNNGTADARVRFDVQGTNWVATGDGSGTDACNVSAVGGDVWTDTTWGGSTLTVAAGAEVTLVITYDGEGDKGAVKNLLVFVDSARGDGATYSSDITLSGMSFTKVGGEEPTPTPDPEDPTADLPEGEWLKYTANDVYTLHNEQEYVDSIRVTYTAAQTNTWLNVNTYILDKATGKTNMTLAVKNDGTETVYFTAKLEKDGTEVNLQKVEIAPGETKIISIDYEVEPDMLFFFIDTDWAETTTTHAGDVTISHVHFK